MTPALVASTTACTSRVGPAGTSTAPLRSNHVARLGGDELRYGAGATAVAGVVYQPDVVLIGGGAAAVREVSGSGLTWTIDANAPGAGDLAVGKIMLATSFGAGRVLKLTSSGGQDRVVLGPVSITDVIRNADLGSSAPIPIVAALAYATPSAPGAAVDDQQDPLATGQRAVAGMRAPIEAAPAGTPAAPVLPLPSTTPSTVGAGDFQVTPFCCAGGVGVALGYDKGGGRLQAKLTLKLDKPTAAFRLVISHGKLLEATVQVHGAERSTSLSTPRPAAPPVTSEARRCTSPRPSPSRWPVSGSPWCCP